VSDTTVSTKVILLINKNILPYFVSVYSKAIGFLNGFTIVSSESLLLKTFPSVGLYLPLFNTSLLRSAVKSASFINCSSGICIL
jgi:hypothetical protein